MNDIGIAAMIICFAIVLFLLLRNNLNKGGKVIKQQYTAENITCYPVDMGKLNAIVNELFHKDKPSPAIEYHVAGKHALVRQPKLSVIDEEFIGGEIETEATFYVHMTEMKPDGGHIGHCVPSHEFTMTLDEIEAYLGTSISLAKFTKKRRGYNFRIRANEGSWMDFFNS